MRGNAEFSTVNHISFFIAIKIKMESTNLCGHFLKDFQAHKYSVNSATRYNNSEVVIEPNGHAFEAELVILT